MQFKNNLPFFAEKLSVDHEQFRYPRVEPGRNDFRNPVRIAEPDESSGFMPQPPEKVWESAGGPDSMGVLRITRSVPGQTVYTASPPWHAPCRYRLQLRWQGRTRSAIRGSFCVYGWKILCGTPSRVIGWYA